MKRLVIICIFAVIVSFGTAAHAASKQESPQQPQTSQPPKAEEGITGKVLETMDSGGYTYALLETPQGKVWVAVPKMKLKKGQNASFYPGAVMANFESKTLKRKFDQIIFSPGPMNEQASGEQTKDQNPKAEPAAPQSAGSKGNVVVTTEKIRVDKAEGPDARTIEEIYTNRAQLDQKKVVVRAKVVKVSQGIMNRNWIHIQDGTGDTKKGTRDLVVTSEGTDVPSVGDIVTVSGTVVKDKDFGAGYNYAVILEKGTFKK